MAGAGKRSAPGAGPKRHNKRVLRSALDLKSGGSPAGCLVTGGVGPRAVRELVLSLAEFQRHRDAQIEVATKIPDPPADKSESEGSMEGLEQADGPSIKSEIKQSVGVMQSAKKRWEIQDTPVSKNLTFLRFHRDLPGRMIHDLCKLAMVEWSPNRESTETSAKRRVRPYKWNARLIPCDIICEPFPDDVKAALIKVVGRLMPHSHGASMLKEEEEPLLGQSYIMEPGQTWGLYLKRRCDMRTVTKDSILELLSSMTGGKRKDPEKETESPYRVSLSDPDFAVVVDINPVFCGIAVCKDYIKLSSYNLHALTNPDILQGNRDRSLRDKAIPEEIPKETEEILKETEETPEEIPKETEEILKETEETPEEIPKEV